MKFSQLSTSWKSRKYTVAAILIVLLATIFLVAYTNRYIPGKITFQEYEPSYLPTGIQLQKKTVDAWYIPAGTPARYTQLHLDADSIFIYEKEKSKRFSDECGHVASNKSCTVKWTVNGQQYRLKTLKSPDQPVVQMVDWLKGETHLFMNMSSDEGYTTDTIEKVIDSFKPVTYQNLPYRYFDKSVI